MSSRPEWATRGAGAAGRRLPAALPVVLVVLVGLTLWWRATESTTPTHEFVGATMGTTYQVTVDADLSVEERQQVRALIEEQLQRVDRLMSTFDTASELSRFNRHRGVEPFPVSPDLLEVLAVARDVSELSGGAFDVTVAQLVDAWGFGPGEAGGTLPDRALVAEVREHVGYRRVVLDAEGGAVLKTDPETQIDLSGIAKGYATERVSAALIERGYIRFLVDVGGELKAIGSRREGRAWRVGIESPDEAMPGIYGAVDLSDEAIATSGDYRNFFERGGTRYAHLIDPRTGAPIAFSGLSVSVVHRNGAVADAWATALTVLGPVEGYELAHRQGLAALFVMRSNDGLESLATPALGDRVTLRTESIRP